MSLIVRLVGHDTSNALVEEGDRASVSNDDVLVVDLLGDEVINVGKSLVSITTAEVAKIPVLLNSVERRVVGVESGISGVLGGSRDSTKKERPDTVSLSVGLVLIESNKNQGLLQKGLVAQGGVQETLKPVTSEFSSGIVTIVGHVGAKKTCQFAFLIILRMIRLLKLTCRKTTQEQDQQQCQKRAE